MGGPEGYPVILIGKGITSVAFAPSSSCGSLRPRFTTTTTIAASATSTTIAAVATVSIYYAAIVGQGRTVRERIATLAAFATSATSATFTTGGSVVSLRARIHYP